MLEPAPSDLLTSWKIPSCRETREVGPESKPASVVSHTGVGTEDVSTWCRQALDRAASTSSPFSKSQGAFHFTIQRALAGSHTPVLRFSSERPSRSRGEPGAPASGPQSPGNWTPHVLWVPGLQASGQPEAPVPALAPPCGACGRTQGSPLGLRLPGSPGEGGEEHRDGKSEPWTAGAQDTRAVCHRARPQPAASGPPFHISSKRAVPSARPKSLVLHLPLAAATAWGPRRPGPPSPSQPRWGPLSP